MQLLGKFLHRYSQLATVGQGTQCCFLSRRPTKGSNGLILPFVFAESIGKPSSISRATTKVSNCAMYKALSRAAYSPDLVMMFSINKLCALVALVLLPAVNAHYTFPSLKVNGAVTPAWANVRKTNNYNSRNPVIDVTSADFRCYDSETNPVASTIKVAAGSQLGIQSDGTIYHPGVVNVYMARATGDINSFKGDGTVWFKVHEEPAITDGGKSINWPSYNAPGITFAIPKNLPSGQYLVRTEHIALHSASTFQGAQFYISCAQVEVTGGGSGTPGPLVAIPGVYTGREPGILINIYYPIPATYQQPGPRPWTG